MPDCVVRLMLPVASFALAGMGFAIAPVQTPLHIDAAPIERALTFAKPDEYTAELRAGEFYAVTAYQENVDLVLNVYDPNGKQLAAVDSPNGSHGPEEWDAVAPIGGTYRFLIRRFDKATTEGKYTMAIRSAGPYIRDWIDRHVDSPRIRRLWEDSMADPHAANAFLAERNGKGPLIEPTGADLARVTFTYMGSPDVTNVKLYSGPSTEWDTPMNRLGSTNLWFVSFVVPLDSRFIYGFEVTSVIRGAGTTVPIESFAQDPLNPVRSAGATATSAQSILELEKSPKQPFSRKPAPREPRGTLVPSKISSKILKEDRTYSVYLPPGFDSSRRGAYGICFQFDGENHGSTAAYPAGIALPEILDNAVAAEKLKPVILVLVNTMGKRARDLACYRPFADFLARELLPAIRAKYPSASSSASHVIVSGSSLGGLAASFCALVHPEAFGNVLSQSGSYWLAGNDVGYASGSSLPLGYPSEAKMPSAFVAAPRLPIRFYLEVGTYESTAMMLRTNRHLRDVLRVKGYAVTYREFHGNHDYGSWRGSLVDGLACLMRDWK